MTMLAVTAHQVALVVLEALDEVPAAEDVRPGWIALGSFLLLAVATVLLWLSMRKQLGKIRFDEDGDADEAQSAPEESDEHVDNGEQRA